MAKIISLNVKGLREKVKRRAIFNYCRERADIICLQETHSSSEVEKSWILEWRGQILFSHGETNARGVCILFKSKVEITDIERDLDGRRVGCTISIDNTPISLVNIYAPNKDSPNYFMELIEKYEKNLDQLIMLGDFNLVLDKKLDRRGEKCNNDNAASLLNEFVSEMSYADPWRNRNPGVFCRSYYRKKSKYTASRIDFALCAPKIEKIVQSIFYIPSIMTDHQCLFMSLSQHENERGRGYWKFNDKLLQSGDFVKALNDLIRKKKIAYMHKNRKECWELIKFEISTFAKNWARENASERRVIISQLYEKSLILEEELSQEYDTRKQNILDNTKLELNQMEYEHAKSVIFRSGARWQVEAERNTEYFYGLEKNRYNAKTCTTLITENGKVIKEQREILNEQRKFYCNLYKKEKNIKFALSDDEHPQLSVEESLNLNQALDVKELSQALKEMKNGKCPGQDGLTVALYKCFWKELRDPLYDAFEHGLEEGLLHASARRGVISLIPKAKSDTRKLKNLRPISLLSVDFKIFEKALANQIKSVIDKLIHTDKKGFMAGRRISVNIRKVLDVIQYADEEKLEAILLSVDFLKCFDRISHEAIWGSLKYFGFGKNFVHMCKTVYCEASSVVQNNGFFSGVIRIEKGVRQGSPNSSFLFLLCAELLAIQLRKDPNIKGTQIGGIANLLNQYADDMDIMTLAKQQGIKRIFDTLEYFYKNTGFKVNYDKTCVYRMGSLKDGSAKFYTEKQITWTNQPVNILGITVHHSGNVMELNYGPIIKKAEGILNAWKKRSLSLEGKIMVINTLVASLFVYPMMVLPTITMTYIRKMESMIRDYLWDGRKAKIALSILQKPKECGGLKLVDFKAKDQALKMSWIKIVSSDTSMARICYHSLDPKIGDDIWNCNLKEEDINKIFKQGFWADVLKAWSLNNYKHDNAKGKWIWYNSDLKINNIPVFWHKCYARNLRTIDQLFKNGSTISIGEAKDFGMNLMEFNSLISAIPNESRRFYKQKRSDTMANDNCSERMKSTKLAYNDLVYDDQLLHPKKEKWEEELSIQMTYESYLKEFLNIRKVTNITKYRSFQYRLLHRAIVTNETLYKWKIERKSKLRELWRCRNINTLVC